MADQTTRRGPYLKSAVVLGVGFAALFDGIVFHQVLQWHQMLTGWHAPDSVENIELNNRADGLFHVAAYLAVAVGVAMLWRALAANGRRPSRRIMLGGVLVGAGGFNVVEGIVDHLLLGVHHVREGENAPAYDVTFLAASVLILATGLRALRPQVTR